MDIRKIIESSPYFDNNASAQACLDSLGKFLAQNNIDLTISPKINARTAIRWGLPLTFFDELLFSKSPFLTRFIKPFSQQTNLNVDDFAELQAAALLLGLGSNSVEPVSRTQSKTYDFDVRWRENIIEVEVTRSIEKELHVKLGNQAEEIAQRLHSLLMPFDLVAHVVELLEPDVKERLLAAAQKIASGETVSEGKNWHLSGKLITRQPFEVFRAGEIEASPDWWPSDAVKLFTCIQTLGGPDTKTAPPRVKVCYTAPFSGYLNSAKKKAKRFQGTLSKPYLILIDANNLPNPFETFQNGLTQSFQKWKHVSGVLIFQDYDAQDEIGWTIQIFENPYASRPLFRNLNQSTPKLNERINLVRKTSSN